MLTPLVSAGLSLFGLVHGVVLLLIDVVFFLSPRKLLTIFSIAFLYFDIVRVFLDHLVCVLFCLNDFIWCGVAFLFGSSK